MKLTEKQLREIIITEIRGFLNEDMGLETMIEDFFSLYREFDLIRDDTDEVERRDELIDEMMELGQDILGHENVSDEVFDQINDILFNSGIN